METVIKFPEGGQESERYSCLTLYELIDLTQCISVLSKIENLKI
jgi:hypothetical protein